VERGAGRAVGWRAVGQSDGLTAKPPNRLTAGLPDRRTVFRWGGCAAAGRSELGTRKKCFPNLSETSRTGQKEGTADRKPTGRGRAQYAGVITRGHTAPGAADHITVFGLKGN